MGQSTLLRISLLLHVLFLTACASATLPVPSTALPPTSPLPTKSATVPIATNVATIQAAAETSIPHSPITPIHPRLLRTLGLGRAVASGLSPDGQWLAVGTTVGWGVYTLPELQEVRFEEFAQVVHALIWSDNSRRLAVVFAQGTTIYRFPKGTLASSQPEITPSFFSPDGKMIASIYYAGGSWAEIVGQPPRPARITFTQSDAASAALPFSLESYGSVAFSPDNRLLATEELTNTLLWERTVSSGTLSGTLTLRVPGIRPLFSPDGRILATLLLSDVETVVQLWEIPTIHPLAQFTVGPMSNSSPPPMTFRQDGTQLALIADSKLQLWDTTRGSLLRSEVVSDGIRLSPGAQTLATYFAYGGNSTGIRFTRIADGHLLYQDEQAKFDDGSVLDSLTWSPDGMRTAYLTGDSRIHVIDLASGTVYERAFPYYTNPTFSPDGEALAAVQLPETVALWHMNDPAFAQQRSLQKPVSPDSYRALDHVEFTPDGQSLAAQEFDTSVQSLRVAAIQWDLANDHPGQTVWELDPPYGGELVKVTDTYLYNPAARAAAWANWDGLQLQRDGGSAITIAPAGTDQVIDMAFSANGRMLVANDNGGSTRLFTITPTTATLIQTLSLARGYGLDGVVLSPDGTLFGLSDGGVGKVWRVGEPSPFVQFGIEGGNTSGSISRFIISSDNQLLIAIRSNDTAIYRLSDGVKLGTLPVPSSDSSILSIPYESVAISPAGDRIAVTDDGRILIWDIGS
jgi:WD40 repeat protein